MASSINEDSSGPISSINVTPFVDVVLVLLVIFMITAPAMMKESLSIRLPKALSQTESKIQSMGIAVTKGGRILLNGKWASEEMLESEVKRALASNPEVQALISADVDARHGDVVRVIDLVKRVGLKRFGIQVDRTD